MQAAETWRLPAGCLADLFVTLVGVAERGGAMAAVEIGRLAALDLGRGCAVRGRERPVDFGNLRW